jgi:hypothetical protein
VSDDVIVKFVDSVSELKEGVNQAKETIASIGEGFSELKEKALEFGEFLAGAFALERLHAFADGMAELGTEATRAAAILGVPLGEIGGLKAVAEASGGSLEELTNAYSRMSRNIIEESDIVITFQLTDRRFWRCPSAPRRGIVAIWRTMRSVRQYRHNPGRSAGRRSGGRDDLAHRDR